MDVTLATIVNELTTAVNSKSHPFRYFTLATVGFNNIPRQRTVILRGVDNALNLTIYTDRRSKKITHINENNQVSLLLYHPQKKLQLSIKAKAIVIRDEAQLNMLWNGIPEGSKKDYYTALSPGSEIESPSETEYLTNSNNFTAITLAPEKIEYLKLASPNHIRIEFRRENGSWKGTYLVP